MMNSIIGMCQIIFTWPSTNLMKDMLGDSASEVAMDFYR